MTRALLSLAAAALATAALAAAAPPPPAEPPPATPPADPPQQQEPPAQPPQPAGIPDLDDLLGIPRSTPGDIPDPSATDLDRRLSGQQIGDAFKEAVGLMNQAAQRLGAADPQRAGVGTQRVQEDAIRKLDQLLASLEQQMSRSQSRQQRSSSSSQDQGRSQPQQQQASASESQNQGENTGENEPPGRRDGPLRPELDSSRAAWGALPARVRDMLLQGSSDQFSSMYEKMTESYYRRLAEERRQ